SRKRPWLIGSAYLAAGGYLAVNVPLMRAMASPLTWPMSQAAGGALADSIRHYLTLGNVGRVMLILMAGLVLPALMRRLPRQATWVACFGGVALVAVGPVASARVDCAGLDRNVLVAFVTSALPHVRSSHEEMDWRASPLERASASSLSPGGT